VVKIDEMRKYFARTRTEKKLQSDEKYRGHGNDRWSFSHATTQFKAKEKNVSSKAFQISFTKIKISAK
jgi:hypothetical protein